MLEVADNSGARKLQMIRRSAVRPVCARASAT
jgi:ribosomal protein L14